MTMTPVEQEVTIPNQTVTSTGYYSSSGLITSENDRQAAMDVIFNNRGSGAYSTIRLVRYTSGYYCLYILSKISDSQYICLEILYTTSTPKLIYWLRGSDGTFQKIWSM